jgi:dihydroorotate dehydrogenase electron transfer subunit
MYYPDRAIFTSAMVIENTCIAESTWRMRCESPVIAGRILPGQFVMLRIKGTMDPLLGRPFAMYEVRPSIVGEPWALDLVYLVVGKMTQALSLLCAGSEVEIWGPLGNGFPLLECDRLLLVAGGIGQTPFLAVTRQALGKGAYGARPLTQNCQHVDFFYGARSASFFAGLDEFEKAGATLHLATDDGSAGTHGLVTHVFREQLVRRCPEEKTIVFTCGPERMMHAVAEISHSYNLPCWASLETPMACGIGACYTCVAPIQDELGGWDYKRTCVEGPVFAAHKIFWTAPGSATSP